MQNRRQALSNVLFGSGAIGLRALATGLPASFLLRPTEASAEALECAIDKNRAQYLVLSTSGAGDPFNANTPGSYEFDDIVHSADPAMKKTAIKLGTSQVNAAQIYSTLPQWVLDRSTFIHHSTLTNAHPNHPKVLRVMGYTDRQEMAPSVFSKTLAGCLGTIQSEPVSAGAGSQFTFEGKALPNLVPTSLRDMLAVDSSPLGKMQALRDASVDKLSALLRDRGTKAQRDYLDQLVISRKQARSLGDELASIFSNIKGNGPAGQIAASVALIKMNVSPVVYVRLPFGGDNHGDADLMVSETPQTIESIGNIALLMQLLKDNGLEDRVTFGVQNVFGRTLLKNGLKGRDHWGSHHVTMLTGKYIKPGVVGGLVPTSGARGKDYLAGSFDSTTGRLNTSGDIPVGESLGAVSRTMGAALGVPASVLEQKIKLGKTIQAALVG